MWEEIDNKLIRQFEFVDFNEAFGFITQIALLAEKFQHHPTITNTWNRVDIALCTHEANNTVTSKDRTLALEIDTVFSRYRHKYAIK